MGNLYLTKYQKEVNQIDLVWPESNYIYVRFNKPKFRLRKKINLNGNNVRIFLPATCQPKKVVKYQNVNYNTKVWLIYSLFLYFHYYEM